MNNVVEFKSAKQLVIEDLHGITIMDLFLLLMEERGYNNLAVIGENELGDIEIIAEDLSEVDSLIGMYNLRRMEKMIN